MIKFKIDNHDVEVLQDSYNKENFVIYWQYAYGYLQQTMYYNILTDRLTYTNHKITERQRILLIKRLQKIYNNSIK